MTCAFIVAMGQPLSGMDFFMGYSQILFDRLSGNGETMSLYIAVFSIIGSLFGMRIVDQFSTKYLLQQSALTCFVALLLFYLCVQLELLLLLPLWVFVFTVGYSFGLGGANNLYVSAIVPPIGLTVIFASSWFVGSLVGLVTPVGLHHLGGDNVMLLFSLCCLGIWLLIKFACPDIKTTCQTSAEIKKEN